MLKFYSLLFGLILISFQSFAQTKYALLTGISNYPTASGWPPEPLSSTDDLNLIRSVLLRQDFKENNIEILKESKLTPENLIKEFESLVKKIKSGDIVYFHYSGHGQQVPDLSEKECGIRLLEIDEKDGYDEALCLYNSKPKWNDEDSLKNHFIDDQLKYYLHKISNKIGYNGQLLVTLDNCSSGSADRSNGYRTKRGINTPYCSTDFTNNLSFRLNNPLIQKNIQNIELKDDLFFKGKYSNYTVYYACRDNELNREVTEYKNFGSLSFAFCRALLQNKKRSFSYLDLDIEIKKYMKLKNLSQSPSMFSSNSSELIFKRPLVSQGFFVSEIISRNEVKINAGKIHDVNVGDSVLLYYDFKDITLKGVINNTSTAESFVSITSPNIPDLNIANKAKISSEIFYQNTQSKVNVALSQSLKDEDKSFYMKMLSKFNNVSFVDIEQSDLIIAYDSSAKSNFNLFITSNGLNFQKEKHFTKENSEVEVGRRIKNYLKIRFYLESEFKNSAINMNPNNIFLIDTLSRKLISKKTNSPYLLDSIQYSTIKGFELKFSGVKNRILYLNLLFVDSYLLGEQVFKNATVSELNSTYFACGCVGEEICHSGILLVYMSENKIPELDIQSDLRIKNVSFGNGKVINNSGILSLKYFFDF